MTAGTATLVLGVGNVLMGDEGVGVHVAQRLAKNPAVMPGVEILDGGTGGFTLLDALTGCLRAVIVDACLDARPPGTVRLRRPRCAAHFPTALGAHDIGVRALVEAAELLGRLPRVLLVTVSVRQPFRTGMDLSPPVAAAVPKVEAAIMRWSSRVAALDAVRPETRAGAPSCTNWR